MNARKRIRADLRRGLLFTKWTRICARTIPCISRNTRKSVQKARKAAGDAEGVMTRRRRALAASGVALFVMDPYFMMGSMGTVVGEKITPPV